MVMRRSFSIPLRWLSSSMHQVASSDVRNPYIFVGKYPGSRVVELARIDDDNRLSSAMLTTLIAHSRSYQDNVAVGAIFFASRSHELFSEGFDASSNDSKTIVDSIKLAHQLSDEISKSNRCTLAIYGGQVSGSSYGVFATSKYRLGTQNTCFRLSEIVSPAGSSVPLPVGGIAYHLVHSFREGLGVARYLGLTGHSIGSDALYFMGLISHIVENECQTSLADALARTKSKNYELKYQQYDVVDVTVIPELLDDLCASSDIDLTEDELVNKLILVPEQPLDLESTDDHLIDEIIMDNYQSMQYCLTPGTLVECRERLQKFLPKNKNESNWAHDVIQAIDSVDPRRAEAWFRLTSIALESKNIQNVYEAEVNELAVSSSWYFIRYSHSCLLVYSCLDSNEHN